MLILCAAGRCRIRTGQDWLCHLGSGGCGGRPLDQQLLQILEGRIEEHRQGHGGQEDRYELVGVELGKKGV